jgi:acetolactate synthase I/III small subunit
MRHVISIQLQNEAGALTRVTGLFSTRGYNIESLSVAPTEDSTVSRITLVTGGSDAVIAQINAQLLKLVDVVSVEDMTSGNHLARELLLVKLNVRRAHLGALNELVRDAGGKVLSDDPAGFIVEITNTESTVSQFIADAGAFGEIVEVVRSGVLAITRATQRVLHTVE